MKNVSKLVAILLIMFATQFLQAAILTIYNNSDFILFVSPVWNKKTVWVALNPEEKKRFDSGLHNVKGVSWAQVNPNVKPDQESEQNGRLANGAQNNEHIYLRPFFKITAKDKKAPHNKIFLGRLNLGAQFEITNDGCYCYKFGIDGHGSGQAIVVN